MGCASSSSTKEKSILNSKIIEVQPTSGINKPHPLNITPSAEKDSNANSPSNKKISQHRNSITLAQSRRKISQASYGQVTVPEEVLRLKENELRSPRHVPPPETKLRISTIINSENKEDQPPKEINFTSGLICHDLILNEEDVNNNLFSIIKRGEIDLFFNFVLQHYYEKESKLHELKGMWESSPLLVAIQYNRIDMARFLLAHPPTDLTQLNQANEKGYTILLYAVMEGYMDLVRQLIAYNVDCNLPVTKETVYNSHYDQSLYATPLMMGIINNHPRIVGILLDHGCSVNQVFNFPTIKSILKPSIQSKGSNKTATLNGVYNMTPILLACAYGHMMMVKELIWRMADFHVIDSDGSNILHHLARCKKDPLYGQEDHIDCEKQPYSSPSNNNNNNNNNTVEDQIFAVIKFLQSKSCIDEILLAQIDLHGDTPLHVAVEQKHLLLVQYLCEQGSNVTKMNHLTGFTPLHIAIRKKDPMIVKYLLTQGADPLRHINHNNASTTTTTPTTTTQPKNNKVNHLSAWELAQKLPESSEIYVLMKEAVNTRLQQLSPDPNNELSTTPTATSSPHLKELSKEIREHINLGKGLLAHSMDAYDDDNPTNNVSIQWEDTNNNNGNISHTNSKALIRKSMILKLQSIDEHPSDYNANSQQTDATLTPAEAATTMTMATPTNGIIKPIILLELQPECTTRIDTNNGEILLFSAPVSPIHNNNNNRNNSSERPKNRDGHRDDQQAHQSNQNMQQLLERIMQKVDSHDEVDLVPHSYHPTITQEKEVVIHAETNTTATDIREFSLLDDSQVSIDLSQDLILNNIHQLETSTTINVHDMSGLKDIFDDVEEVVDQPATSDTNNHQHASATTTPTTNTTANSPNSVIITSSNQPEVDLSQKHQQHQHQHQIQSLETNPSKIITPSNSNTLLQPKPPSQEKNPAMNGSASFRRKSLKNANT
jgi:ankyrin repeat protein